MKLKPNEAVGHKKAQLNHHAHHFNIFIGTYRNMPHIMGTERNIYDLKCGRKPFNEYRK